MSSITFVTSFLDIYGNAEEKDKNPEKSIEKRIYYFKEMASTGIQICLYISQNMEKTIKPILEEYSNISCVVISLQDTKIWKIVNENYVTLPNNRSHLKDTTEFMILMNNKIEFIENTIKNNPWNSTHFAWIDFSIFYVFKNPEFCKNWLQFLSVTKLAPHFLTIPGCPNINKLIEIGDNILNNVYWRFCGGFFIGDKDSLLDFYHLYMIHFPTFIQKYNKIVWEVNFWVWLESYTNWSPIWYEANHNDSILQLSSDYYSEDMSKHTSIKKKYDYPVVYQHNPSSASYIEYEGHKILNTRYVNYILYDNGSYNVHAPDKRTLNTMNYISFLDDDFTPKSYVKIDETKTNLTDYLYRAKNYISKGFEDIRLYISNGKLKFIATTIQYSPLGQNRMVFGEYNIYEKQINSVHLIEPPDPNTWCEKNWIPITYNTSEEFFIYSWSPFQVGKLVESNSEFSHKLEIILKEEYHNIPFLNKIRGSSTFVSYDENHIIGVVHYSEEYSPRHYYHLLVKLDRKTLCIMEISQPFYFQKIGIEFCTGFTTNLEREFCFWISQMDRDPIFITIPSNKFNWTCVQH